MKQPEITSNRLILRRLENFDWKVISFLRSDKEVNKFIKRPCAETKEKALQFILKINNGVKTKALYYWSISEKKNPTMIGSICLWNFSKDRKTAEIGYDLSPEFQNKGIMDEALKNVLEFGFFSLNLESVEAFTHRENRHSKKLLEKNNFKLILGRKDTDNIDNVVFIKSV